MTKPELEFHATESIPWQAVPGNAPGISERILAFDATTGIASRMLKYEPGTDTSPNGVQSHPFWEEIYIVQGWVRDLTLDQTFKQGYYACRPPGMPHGPWESPEGCILFEVRYYSR